MDIEIHDETDIAKVAAAWAPSSNGTSPKVTPTIMSIADLYKLQLPKAGMLIDQILPTPGVTLLIAAAKAGKTILSIQAALAVARGSAFLDNYKTLDQGSTLIIEQDDPAGAGSIRQILQRADAAANLPLYVVPALPFGFGEELIEWLEAEILAKSVRLTVLDSYTSLRSSRRSGGDIVKSEQTDLTTLDALGKRTGCALLIVHHISKGSVALDWSQQAGGTFAMAAATEAQIHLSRFADFEGSSPERLIRIRGRHFVDRELVVRFRAETLDYEFVLEGGAAAVYPALVQIRTAFQSNSFSAKDLTHATGVSRATAHRQIERLYRSDALHKRSSGEYFLAALKGMTP